MNADLQLVNNLVVHGAKVTSIPKKSGMPYSHVVSFKGKSLGVKGALLDNSSLFIRAEIVDLAYDDKFLDETVVIKSSSLITNGWLLVSVPGNKLNVLDTHKTFKDEMNKLLHKPNYFAGVNPKILISIVEEIVSTGVAELIAGKSVRLK